MVFTVRMQQAQAKSEHEYSSFLRESLIDLYLLRLVQQFPTRISKEVTLTTDTDAKRTWHLLFYS